MNMLDLLKNRKKLIHRESQNLSEDKIRALGLARDAAYDSIQNKISTRYMSFGTIDNILEQLPTGSRIAVVTMTGSFCPVTKGHIAMFSEARDMLVQRHNFDACVGFISLNSDEHVSNKIGLHNQYMMTEEYRVMLIDVATEHMHWLISWPHDSSPICPLRQKYQKLLFEHFTMNGADDVLKFEKWQYASPQTRYLTMGRACSIDLLQQQMHHANYTWNDNFLLGPGITDMNGYDISSSDVRKALSMRHLEKLRKVTE
jgi:nicotinic acid mononucleotide adenylyltransferase